MVSNDSLHLPFSAVSASWRFHSTEAPKVSEICLAAAPEGCYCFFLALGEPNWWGYYKILHVLIIIYIYVCVLSFSPSWRVEIIFLLASTSCFIFPTRSASHLPRSACFTTSSNLLIMVKVAATAFQTPNEKHHIPLRPTFEKWVLDLPSIHCSWLFLVDSSMEWPFFLSSLSVPSHISTTDNMTTI